MRARSILSKHSKTKQTKKETEKKEAATRLKTMSATKGVSETAATGAASSYLDIQDNMFTC